MQGHHFKSIASLIEEVTTKHLPEGDISALSKQLERIISCWPQCTDDMMSQNVTPVRLDEEVLIVETHSPVWANKMRYKVRTALRKLHEYGFNKIKFIKIKVNPRLRR